MSPYPQSIARGGCALSTDPKSAWTSTAVVLTGPGRFAGFRTHLPGKQPRV